MSEEFVNLYSDADGEQISGCFFKSRKEAEKAGRDGIPEYRRVALVRIERKPASGLGRPKYEDMGQGAWQ